MKTNKEYCKSLLGKSCFEKDRQFRKGKIKNIAFHDKDYSICWYNFKWEKGEYLISIEDIILLNQEAIQMNLF